MVRCILLSPLILVALMVAAQAGGEDRRKIPAAAKTILDKADSFELYSLEPDQPKEKPKDEFHGWKVLGKTTVKDAATRKKLVAALANGVSEYKQEGAKCFEPRHGIRVSHDGKTADFVICFACSHVETFVNGERQKFLVSGSPSPVFNEVLKKAGVLLPKSAD